jgi:hypothetical protein
MTTTVERPPAITPTRPPEYVDRTPVTYTLRATDGSVDNVTWTLEDRDAIAKAEAVFNTKVHGDKYSAASVTSEGAVMTRTFDPLGDVVLRPQLVGG